MAVDLPPCVNVGTVCVAPEYAKVVNVSVGLGIGHYPKADPGEVAKQGVEIGSGSSDLVTVLDIQRPGDDAAGASIVCKRNACVAYTLRMSRSPKTGFFLEWDPAVRRRRDRGEASLHWSVGVEAKTPSDAARAIQAVWITTAKPSVIFQLSDFVSFPVVR